jgi:glycosyltransferase involved in cell wall biosynthesis
MSRRIRLLEVIGSLHIGGAENVVVNLARGLDRSRFELAVLCTRQRGVLAERLAAEGFDVRLVAPQHRRWRHFTPWLLWREIRRYRADVVHTHGTPALLHTGPLAALRLLPTWVHTFHFGNYSAGLTRDMQRERRFCRFASQLITVADTQRETLLHAYGLPPARVRTIVNGVEHNQFLDAPAVRAQKRAELGLGPDEIAVGSIAVLSEQKGITYLLRAAEQFLAGDPRLRLVIVGGGPLEAGLRAEAGRLSHGGRILFTGWRQDSREMMTALDVFVMSSLWEAMPMVLLEAMAARRAIVATDVGENRIILDDGRCGLLVPPRDPASLAQAIQSLTARPDMAAAVALRAAERHEQVYTVSRMVREHERLLTDLTGSAV